MGSSMKLFTLTFVLLALIELGFGLICSNPEAYKNTFVADPKGKQKGECVSFYKTCSKDPRNTTLWRKGVQVKNNRNIPYGTGIATFSNGDLYVGSKCGRPLPCGHVAIYVGQNSQGIQVWDQWKSRPVSNRTIFFDGRRTSSNDGNQFYVIN